MFVGRLFRSKLTGHLPALMVAALLTLGCRPGADSGVVVTRTIVVGGEEMVVTRLVDRAIDVPVTVTRSSKETEPVVLDISMVGEPGELDPQRASGQAELDLIENLFVGLTRYDSSNDTIVPELATAWDISDDGLIWTFHLRDDIFWVRSGLAPAGELIGSRSELEPYRPVVADDAVRAIQRACDPRLQSPDSPVLFIIEGCESVHRKPEVTERDLSSVGARAVDDFTLEITLTRPATYFAAITSMWLLRPVPREIVEMYSTLDESWASIENVIVSGPFIVGEETVNKTRTVLKRNPFWPVSSSGNVDVVNIVWLPADDAYSMWLDKDLDVSPLAPGMREEILGDTRLRSRLQLVTNQAVFYLAYNHESSVFADAAVRRAFGAAIDRETLIEDVYGGHGMPMRHFSPPGVIGAPPLELVGVGYSPDRARLEMQSSSIRDCQFLPIIRYLVSATDLALFHAETLRSMWQRELGCPEEQIQIEQVQLGTLLANTQPDAGSLRPDLWDLAWSSYFPDAHNWLADALHCSESENRQNRPCSEADRLIIQSATLQSIEERWTLYRQAERLFFGEGGIEPVTPLFVQGDYIMVQPWLSFHPAHFGGEQYDTYVVDVLDKRLEREQ